MLNRPRRPARAALLSRGWAVAAALVIAVGTQGAAVPRVAARDAGTGSAAQVGGEAQAAPVQPHPSEPPALAAFNPANVALSLQLVTGGFSNPVLVTNAGDGSNRLFVVQQSGTIWVVSGGTKLATPFIDLSDAISTSSEQGLLGLAFHPKYPALPYFYVNFTDHNGRTVINRYQVSSNPNVADRASGVRILTISQPYGNHNGGNLAFGPDGYLYIGMGDGGGTGDPGNRAQSLSTLLGKMLRIDINHGDGPTKHYRSPSTNPYAATAGLDEIWSRGLRNPWRWSFDRATGALWIADVGQDRYEEVDRSLKAGTTPAGRGANYGWPILEARACYRPATGCSTSGKTMPLLAYSHSSTGPGNCSITGGFVYRGAADPVLRGGYLYGDFCSGRIWVVSATAAAPASGTLVWSTYASPHLMISSFGEDEAGELYAADYSGGGIYRVRASAKG